MIVFLTTPRKTLTFDVFLSSEWFEERLEGRVMVLPYSKLSKLNGLDVTSVVFCDQERLTRGEMSAVMALWDRLEKSTSIKLINKPDKVLFRLTLHEALYRDGINSYQSKPVGDQSRKLKYPVFLKVIHDHKGALSPLLYNDSEFKRGLKKSTFPYTRYFKKDIMVIEYCDVVDQRGHYPKYASNLINGKIIPRSRRVGTEWQVNSRKQLEDMEHQLAEKAFQDNNDEEPLIRSVFETAGIEFGRIDYGISGGQIQVWEINTNPMIAPKPTFFPKYKHRHPREIFDIRRANFQQFTTAFCQELYNMLKDNPNQVVGNIPKRIEIQYRTAYSAKRFLGRIVGGLSKAHNFLRGMS